MAGNQNISFTFSIDNDNFSNKIQAMNKEMKTFEQEIKQSSNEVLKSGKNLESLGNKYDAINKALEQARDKVEVYEKQIEKQNSAIDKSKNKLTELGKKKEEINKTYEETVKATGKESEASLKLEEELDKLNQQYKNTEKSITSKEKTLQNYAVSLSQAQTQVSNLEVELKKCSDEIEEQGNKFAESSKKFAEVGSSFENVGGSLKDLGDNVQKAGALIVTAGVGLGAMALDTENDLNKLGGRLGVTVEEAENLKKVARTLYTNGFGESLEECVNDLVLLQQNIKETSNMTDEQKGKLLEQISTVKTLFGVESEELTRTLNNMLKNGLIDNLEEGLDLITIGFQNGLNSGGDLLDVLYEYSPQFKKLGLDGQSALEMIKAGLDAGGYNADKMADAIKELSIRVIDGSNTTKEGFELIGENAEEMAEKFSKGGDSAKEALNETINGLKNIKDPLAQDLAGVNLFGTMWEDSSKEAILAMSNIGNGLGDITGATQKAGEEVNNSIGKKFTSSIRKLKDELLPLGEALLPFLDDAIEGIGDITNIISKLDPEIASSIAKFGALALVFGTTTKATGSLVEVLGKGVTGVSSLLKIAGDTKELGSFTQALGNSEMAIGGLIKGFSSLGSVSSILTTSILPVAVALGAATAAVYAYKEGNEAINSTIVESKGEYSGLEKAMASLMGVQLRSREELEELGLIYKDFNENISEEFQGSVKDMTTDIHDFGLAMSEITLDGVFSEEEASNMTSRVDNVLKSTLSTIENKAQEMQDGLGKAFGIDGIIDENESALLEYWSNRGIKEKEEAQNLQNEINNIILTARNEGRNLTSEEEEKIRYYYAQIKQIELEALASNQYEIEYATQEFQNRIATMDAEEAQNLLSQRFTQYEEQRIAIQTNYDTLIAMAKENYVNLSAEEKLKVDETVARLEESKSKELEINKQKYDESLNYSYEHNENLRAEFNRFTGELVAEKDRAYYAEYERMMTHYADIENVTKSGYQRVYDNSTKTWKDLYVIVDETTKQIKGVYDLNSMNVTTMNKNDEAVLRDEVVSWQQTAQGILSNCLLIGNAYINAEGQIANSSGTIIGKLGQVKNANGELVDAILDVNGNPINIGENTNTVINNLKETQKQVKATDGMKAQIIVTDNGTVSNVQRDINNITGKTVVVGVQYDESGKPHWNGSTIYARGTLGTSTDEIATVNENATWELVDTQKGKEAYLLGRNTLGEMAYLPEKTKVTTALASTQKMESSIKREVNNQILNSNYRVYDAIKLLTKEMNENKSVSISMGGITVQGNVSKDTLPEIEKALNSLYTRAIQYSNKYK
ncbi:phage tail tape measure protein [Clostridium tertium]|uniref:phage tail tape measure protein n=1 Tax=Clostridium tertium TaxID=1559 RepID=UPI0024B3943B|nr:phage tail tape measure protein [Clostridium tertium]MDI9215995.1 phage tail tape measure protein [Clostridium tertium]